MRRARLAMVALHLPAAISSIEEEADLIGPTAQEIRRAELLYLEIGVEAYRDDEFYPRYAKQRRSPKACHSHPTSYRKGHR